MQQSSKKKERAEIAILWIKRKTYAKLNQIIAGRTKSPYIFVEKYRK